VAGVRTEYARGQDFDERRTGWLPPENLLPHHHRESDFTEGDLT